MEVLKYQAKKQEERRKYKIKIETDYNGKSRKLSKIDSFDIIGLKKI